MLQAIMFDVDGTLVDSVDLHAKAWQEGFARFGRQIRFEQIRSQIGKGADQLIPTFLPPDEVERYGEELEHFRSELFREHYMAKVKPFPRVRELFERTRRAGRRIVLASSAKESEIDHYIDLLGVRDLTHGRTTSDDVERSKPYPDVFAAAMSCAGVHSPDEALAVGDSPFDAQAAGRIGIRTVGVLCGRFPEEQLRDAGCIALFGDPADLLTRFDQSPLARDALTST